MRIGGIGTMWLGASRRDSEDRRFATLWFTFLFAPIVPLRRSLLRLLPHRGSGFSCQELARGPLVAGEVVKTLLFSWIFVPVVAVGPSVPAVEELRLKLGIPQSWQIPWIAIGIVWLAVFVWKLADWHERRFRPDRRLIPEARSR
jgi:hypothetical protein